MLKRPDGRLKVERIQISRPDDEERHLRGSTRVGDLLIKDAATDELRHRIAVPEGTYYTSFNFTAGSRRLLVQFVDLGNNIKSKTSPRRKNETGPPSDWLTWELYDTGTWEVVARGELQSQEQRLFGPPRLTVSPGGRWIVMGGRGDKELIVRDGLTNRITCKMEAPEGSAIGEILFDPAHERLAVATVPTPLAVSLVVRRGGGRSVATPAAPGPFDLQMLDPATGVALWTQQAVDECSDPGRREFRGATQPMFQMRMGGRPVPRRLLGRNEYVPCLGGADRDRGARADT